MAGISGSKSILEQLFLLLEKVELCAQGMLELAMQACSARRLGFGRNSIGWVQLR
jgi:hypothetical protein